MVAMAAEALMAGKAAGEVGLLLGPPTEFGACRTCHDGSLGTSKLIHYESFFNEGPLVCKIDISGGEWGRHTPISACHRCWHHDLSLVYRLSDHVWMDHAPKNVCLLHLDPKNRMNFG